MLSMTRRTEYALIALCHLARVGEKVVSARDLADRHAMPLPLLMNVLKSLTQAGFVRSIRGAHGGYSLAGAPGDISLSDLIQAIEGPIKLVRCVGAPHAGDLCEMSSACRIRGPILRVHDRLKSFLDTITLAELAWDDANIRELTGLMNLGTATHAIHLSR